MKLAHERERDRRVLSVERGTPPHPDSHAAAVCPTCGRRVFPNHAGEDFIGCAAHPDAATRRNVPPAEQEAVHV